MPKDTNEIKTTINSLNQRRTTQTNIMSTEGFYVEPEKEVKGPLLLLGYFGIFMMVIGLIVLFPLIMLIFYPSEVEMYRAFLVPGLLSFGLGVAASLTIFRRKQGRLTPFEDLILVIGVWVLMIFISCFPYMFYGYNFSQAFYESTSGYTGAGLSTIDWSRAELHVESAHMLHFFRAFNQFVGGVGLVLIVSSAVSASSGLNLYLLEGHNDKLLPNLAKSARMIFGIYLGIIAGGTLLYIIVGVNPFDAICHSMTAVATGGFSTYPGNVHELVEVVSVNGAWRGVLTEIITEILMLLGALNFVIHYSILRGKFKALKHFEMIVFFFILAFFVPIMIYGMADYYGNFWQGVRYGLFESISAFSTAGFQAVDNYQVHLVNGSSITSATFVLLVLAILMSIGGQSGSTSGAIKQSRVAFVFMDIYWRIKEATGKPENVRVYSVYRYGNRERVSKEEVREAQTYVGIYVAILFLGSLLLSIILHHLYRSNPSDTNNYNLATGTSFNFLECFFEYSSTMGTVGLSVGISHAHTHPSILWIELIGMLLGRLEIFVFFTLGGKSIHFFRHKKNIYNPEKSKINQIDNSFTWAGEEKAPDKRKAS